MLSRKNVRFVPSIQSCLLKAQSLFKYCRQAKRKVTSGRGVVLSSKNVRFVPPNQSCLLKAQSLFRERTGETNKSPDGTLDRG